MLRVNIFLALASFAVPSQSSIAQERIPSRVPQQHYDSFIRDCRGKSLPAATCSCMAVELIKSGKDGDAALDVLGLQSLKITNPDVERKAMVSLLDRHGMTGNQLMSAMVKLQSLLPKVISTCS